MGKLDKKTDDVVRGEDDPRKISSTAPCSPCSRLLGDGEAEHETRRAAIYRQYTQGGRGVLVYKACSRRSRVPFEMGIYKCRGKAR